MILQYDTVRQLEGLLGSAEHIDLSPLCIDFEKIDVRNAERGHDMIKRDNLDRRLAIKACSLLRHNRPAQGETPFYQHLPCARCRRDGKIKRSDSAAQFICVYCPRQSPIA